MLDADGFGVGGLWFGIQGIGPRPIRVEAFGNVSDRSRTKVGITYGWFSKGGFLMVPEN